MGSSKFESERRADVSLLYEKEPTMLKGMAILMAFQLTGELLAVGFRLPISGPIIGMALLLLWLQGNGRIESGVASASDALLANMAVLFVPVGVGAMAYGEIFRRHWMLITVAVVVGTVVTIATTALTARLLTRRRAPAASHTFTG
jgi:holin-like protein